MGRVKYRVYRRWWVVFAISLPRTWIKLSNKCLWVRHLRTRKRDQIVARSSGAWGARRMLFTPIRRASRKSWVGTIIMSSWLRREKSIDTKRTGNHQCTLRAVNLRASCCSNWIKRKTKIKNWVLKSGISRLKTNSLPIKIFSRNCCKTSKSSF